MTEQTTFINKLLTLPCFVLPAESIGTESDSCAIGYFAGLADSMGLTVDDPWTNDIERSNLFFLMNRLFALEAQVIALQKQAKETADPNIQEAAREAQLMLELTQFSAQWISANKDYREFLLYS